MKKPLSLIGLCCLSLFFGCDDSGTRFTYDPAREMTDMYGYIIEYLPEIQDVDDPYEKLVMLRDLVYQNTKREAWGVALPLEADVFRDCMEGERGTACQGMSFLFAGCLQVFGYDFRLVGLWSGEFTDEGIEYSHSVAEVLIDGEWEVHDAYFNSHFEGPGGDHLNAQGIKEICEAGLEFYTDTDGFVLRPGDSIDDMDHHYCFYLNEITYEWGAVFF